MNMQISACYIRECWVCDLYLPLSLYAPVTCCVMANPMTGSPSGMSHVTTAKLPFRSLMDTFTGAKLSGRTEESSGFMQVISFFWLGIRDLIVKVTQVGFFLSYKTFTLCPNVFRREHFCAISIPFNKFASGWPLIIMCRCMCVQVFSGLLNECCGLQRALLFLVSTV